MFFSHVSPRYRSTGFALIIGIAVVRPTSAEPPRKESYLDQVRRVNEVTSQKAESDVRAALFDAQRLAGNDNAKAADRLKRALSKLEDDTSLTPARRDNLTHVLQNRIKALEAAPEEKVFNEKELQAGIRRAENARANDDEEKIRTSLYGILALQKDGKLTEAKRQAEELKRQYPNNPVAETAARTVASFDQLASMKSFQRDKDHRVEGALNDIDRSSLPPAGDIEFPKDWKERTKNRSSSLSPTTAKERAILESLNTPVTVNFKDEKFEEVLTYLATVLGQPIILDKDALNDAQITYETPISLSVKNVTARTLLRRILGEFGLTYIIKDQSIQVISQVKARESVTVRSYYIGDLLGATGGPGDPLTRLFGPNIGNVQAVQNIAGLIDMLQTVDPQSWQVNGGLGTVYFNAATMSLVVKQSAEVHSMLGSSLLH